MGITNGVQLQETAVVPTLLVWNIGNKEVMRAHVRPGKRPLAGKMRSLAERPSAAVASSSMLGCMDEPAPVCVGGGVCVEPAPVCVGGGWSPCQHPDLEK